MEEKIHKQGNESNKSATKNPPPPKKTLLDREWGGGGPRNFIVKYYSYGSIAQLNLKKKNYLNKPVKSEFLMTFIAKIGKKGSPECLSKQTTCQEAGSAHLRKWICLFIPRTMLLLVI